MKANSIHLRPEPQCRCSSATGTLVMGLAFFVTSELEGLTQLPYLLAVNTIVMMPCILLFLCFQKEFIQGVVITGVKG